MAILSLMQLPSWPEQTADIRSEGLKLPLEMQAYACETLLYVNVFVQWCRLSRCQSDVFACCCMPASMYAYSVHGYNAAVKA